MHVCRAPSSCRAHPPVEVAGMVWRRRWVISQAALTLAPCLVCWLFSSPPELREVLPRMLMSHMMDSRAGLCHCVPFPGWHLNSLLTQAPIGWRCLFFDGAMVLLESSVYPQMCAHVLAGDFCLYLEMLPQSPLWAAGILHSSR